MVEETFIPQKGDIIKLSLSPQNGHEQGGWRPGLVISNYTFNRSTGFALICPITNTNRGYPFHIELSEGCNVTGVIMVVQVKPLDYIKRRTAYLSSIEKQTIK